MSRTAAPLLLLLLAAAGGAAALDLLDPSKIVEALSAGVGVERWRRPDFCGKYDCPPYRRKERTDNWEMRRYESGKWIMTNVSDTKYELAYTKAATKLLKYFKGSNSENKTFDVTTPTFASVKLENGGEGTERNYNFSLWLPEEVQRHTPQPTDADLKVVKLPCIDWYIRVFGGFATESTILKEAKGLMDMLDEEGRDFDNDIVVVAVYDPPTKLLSRHNEVLFVAGKNKKWQRKEAVQAA
ncbi:hypothetical protein ABPG77_010757 [Micractinium sp. CCAP 211/92]